MTDHNKPGTGLEQLTLNSVRAASLAAEAKHPWARILRNPDMSRAEKLACLGEEFGEICELFTYDKRVGYEMDGDWWQEKLIRELLQLAQCAASWAEAEEHRSSEVEATGDGQYRVKP